MALLVLVSILTCIAVGSAIGLRLIALARRTREVPELLIGVGILAYASLALPPLLLKGVPGIGLFALRALQITEQIGQVATIAAVLAFTWRVFRPEAVWALALTVGWTVVGLVGSTGVLIESFRAPDGIADGAALSVYINLIVITFGAAFLWTGLESLRYHAKLRRRLALGLADPLVANRVLLFGIWGMSLFLLDLLHLGYNAAGMDFSRDAAPLLTICASTLLSSGIWYLAFLAPEGYRRLVLSGARS